MLMFIYSPDTVQVYRRRAKWVYDPDAGRPGRGSGSMAGASKNRTARVSRGRFFIQHAALTRSRAKVGLIGRIAQPLELKLANDYEGARGCMMPEAKTPDF